MAAGGSGGDDEVRAALADVVRSRPEVADDPERLNGYLRDMCPTRAAEVAVIVVAVRAGVRDDLSRASQGHAVEALSARLAGRLHTEFGIDEGLARWAVDSWAVAMGVLHPNVVAQKAPTAPDDALRAMAAQVAPAPPDEDPDAPATPMVEEPTRQPSPMEAAGRTVHRPQPPVATPPPVAPGSNPWRMRALVGGALSACLALVAVLALVAGDSGDGAGPASETAGPTTTAAPPTVTTTPPTTPAPTVTTAAPSPLPGGPAAIAPGAYRTTKLRPGITATVADGWRVTAEQPDFLDLRSAEGDTHVLSVLRPERPLRRASAFPKYGEAIGQAGSVEAKPDDYVAWLRSHTRLSVSEPRPVVKGGFRGTQVDVTVRSAYSADYCGAPCVALFQLDEGILFTLFEGNRNRVYVFTVGDSQILIVTEAPADRFQAFADRADRLVETIRFTG